MNNNKVLLALFVIFLALLNVYQIYNSHIKSEKISQLVSDYENLEIRNTSQNNFLNQRLFLESLLFDTSNVNTHAPSPNNKFSLISIFPENSCGACILYDSRLIADLKKQYPEQINIYALSPTDVFSKDNLFPRNFEYLIIRDINEIIAIKDSFDYSLNSPLHLLLNSNKDIISVHLSNFYVPENSDVFFNKIESTF